MIIRPGRLCAPGAVTSAPASSLLTDLVEWWEFNDATGVNGNTLTVGGSVPFSGGAATFTGDTANSLSRAAQTWGVSTDSTVASWFTTSSLAADQTPYQFGDNPGIPTANTLTLNIGPTGQYMYLNGASGSKLWGSTTGGTELGVVAGALTLIVVTVSGGTVKVYSQGSDVSAALPKIVDTALTMSDTSRPFYVGKGDFGGGAPYQPWNGSVHAIGNWSRAITAAEVTTLWNGGTVLGHPF